MDASRKDERTPYRLSSGLDMTVWPSATRQSNARYRSVVCGCAQSPVLSFDVETCLASLRILIFDEFAIYNSASKGTFEVCVVWKEESRLLEILIVAVDLNE